MHIQESVIGDVFGVELCDAASELDTAMRSIVSHGAGILVYLARRSTNKQRIVSSLRSLQMLQDTCSVDNVPPALAPALDIRDMGNVHSILQAVRASSSLTMITDDTTDVSNLRAFGHDVEMLRLRDLSGHP